MKLNILSFLFIISIIFKAQAQDGDCCICQETGIDRQVGLVRLSAEGNYNCKLTKEDLSRIKKSGIKIMASIKKISEEQAMKESENDKRFVEWDMTKCTAAQMRFRESKDGISPKGCQELFQ